MQKITAYFDVLVENELTIVPDFLCKPEFVHKYAHFREMKHFHSINMLL